MTHLLSCPTCGPFGVRARARRRRASAVQERGLVAFFVSLNAARRSA